MPFVYIVRCADGTLYTGFAMDVGRRLEAHNAGRGARYTSGRRPVSLVFSEACPSREAALRREHQLKQLSKRAKEGLIAATAPRRRGGTAKPVAKPGGPVAGSRRSDDVDAASGRRSGARSL